MMEWAVTSSVLILVVLLVRHCLKGHMSLRLQYGLWALVLVRLLLPITFGAAPWSVLNGVSVVEKETYTVVGNVGGETPDLSVVEPDPSLPLEEQQQQYEENKTQWQEEMEEVIQETGTPVSVAGVVHGVWGAGAITVALWLLWVNVRFARRLRRSRQPLDVEGYPLPVYVTGAVPTPCLFGLFRPCVYVTPDTVDDERVLRHALVHEYTHYRHRDYIWSALRGACLALHWYNPLVWVAAALSSRDGELCCDEATVASLGEGERAAYGRTLLAVTCQGTSNLLLAATSMTGSGRNLKERIVLLAKRPKTAVYTLVAVVVIAAVAVGCTFAGADKEGEDFPGVDSDTTQILTTADLDWDGVKEQIQVVEMEEGVYQLEVWTKDGACLLREQAAESHVGWNSLYLYTDEEGKEYLLRYNPYMSTGLGDYHFELFTLEGGEQVTVQQGGVSFVATELPQKAVELRSFAQQVNQLLRRSSLLLSTQDGYLIVGPEEVGAHMENLEMLNGVLSQAELEEYQEKLSQLVTGEDGTTYVSPVSHFFTSYYESPKDLDLEQFLRYFPDDGTVPADANNEEFQALTQHPLWPFGEDGPIPVPIHRYTRESVDKVLEQYGGITTQELTGVGAENLIYLSEYDAWYNFTSDFAAGTFTCAYGMREGDMVKLWEPSAQDGTPGDTLALKETEDGFQILCHLPAKWEE